MGERKQNLYEVTIHKRGCAQVATIGDANQTCVSKAAVHVPKLNRSIQSKCREKNSMSV